LLKVQREEILGWAKQQLAEFAKSDVKIQLSAKTIERVERNTGYFAPHNLHENLAGRQCRAGQTTSIATPDTAGSLSHTGPEAFTRQSGSFRWGRCPAHNKAKAD
jgi:hypothetical protein